MIQLQLNWFMFIYCSLGLDYTQHMLSKCWCQKIMQNPFNMLNDIYNYKRQKVNFLASELHFKDLIW